LPTDEKDTERNGQVTPVYLFFTPHADFWRRYFYKVNQLQIDEARKLALMKRAEQSEKKEDSINWDG
jgi:hypothetical protein